MTRFATVFEKRVYEVLRRVPEGKVTTYAALARAVGCGSSRAIGQALRRNPFAPTVPCHRVIRSDLRLGGFRGRETGAEVGQKKALLAREGVRFKGTRLMDHNRVILEM